MFSFSSFTLLFFCFFFLSSYLFCCCHSLSSFVGSISFEDIDIHVPNFDVDWGESPADRWYRISQLANQPLRGWDWSVNETDIIANIDYVATHMLQYGFNIITIDYYWYLDMDGRTMYLDN